MFNMGLGSPLAAFPADWHTPPPVLSLDRRPETPSTPSRGLVERIDWQLRRLYSTKSAGATMSN